VVGAKDLRPERFIACQDGGGWMAKAVVPLHREYDGAGAKSSENGFAAESTTAMMGWLH
jgi:hypothetical protein